MATLPVPVEESGISGSSKLIRGCESTAFKEKPEHADSMPGAPGRCLASMGNYLFDPQVLRNALIEDAAQDLKAIMTSGRT